MLTFLLLFPFVLTQGCVSDNPDFSRILTTLPSFMIQMGQVTLPPGGDSTYEERCNAIAIDPQDEGIYCASRTRGDFVEVNGDSTHATPDALLVKFDRDKKLLWARQFGNTTFPGENSGRDIFTDIAFDSRGNVLVGGSSNSRAVVAKFTRKGDLLWKRIISGSSVCASIAIRNDRIFCGGFNNTTGFAQAYEIDQNGNRLWLRETTGGADQVTEIALDRSGNLILVGNTLSPLFAGHTPGGLSDGFIWKVSPSGQELWLEKVGTDLHEEVINSVAVDQNGDIVIGGYFRGSGADPEAGEEDDDFDPGIYNRTVDHSFVSKYSDTEVGISHRWSIKTHQTQSNFVTSVAISRRNEIVAGGYTKGSFFETNADGLESDAYLSVISSSGVSTANLQFGDVTRGKFDNTTEQLCLSVAIDPLGNILCGGLTRGSTEEPFGGGSDIMIWRMKPDLSFSE